MVDKNLPKGNSLLRSELRPQRGERGSLDDQILESLSQRG